MGNIDGLKSRYEKDTYTPSTRIGGGYSVLYQPAFDRVTITIRPDFEFVDDAIVVSKDDLELAKKTGKAVVATGHDVWTEEDKARFIAGFKGQADLWSSQFTFWCQEPGREGNKATVVVEVETVVYPMVGSGPSTAHVRVIKDQWGAQGTFERSSVLGSSAGLGQPDEVFTMPLDISRPGERSWPGDLLMKPTVPAMKHPTIAHELGHLLAGMDDEYTEVGKYARGDTVRHSPAVQAAFGHPISYGWNPKSVMAEGSQILPEHGVMFREALEKVSGMRWSHVQRAQPK